MVLALCIGLFAALANWLFQALVKRSGSIFAGQSSYVITIAGIGWSVLLLNEAPPASLWIGVAGVLLGVLIVRPNVPTSSPTPVPKGEPAVRELDRGF